jgi:5-formyltetrahydrofolate cyclo-ligase
MGDKKVQIRLKSDIQLEAELIELLNAQGKRSFLPKLLLLNGFEKYKKDNSLQEVAQKNEKKQSSVAFLELATKG